MRKRRVFLARSRAGKRTYKRRQRKQALRQATETLMGLIPGASPVMTVYGLSKAYTKLQRSR